jgi:hypothetical protein
MEQLIKNSYKMSQYDIDALKKLNIKIEPNLKLKHGVIAFVGDRYEEYGYIKIWVTAYPAKFWDLEIKADDEKGKIVKLSMGSGSLMTYLPFIQEIIKGNIVIEDVVASEEVER